MNKANFQHENLQGDEKTDKYWRPTDISTFWLRNKTFEYELLQNEISRT